jgi:hypothetical protein
LERQELVYLVAVWNIGQAFGTSYGQLVHFVVIWHIFPGFRMLYQEKSGNPGRFARLL